MEIDDKRGGLTMPESRRWRRMKMKRIRKVGKVEEVRGPGYVPRVNETVRRVVGGREVRLAGWDGGGEAGGRGEGGKGRN